MTAPPTAAGEIAQLAVEIDDVTPRVMRCVEVPVDIRLDDLHFVLQIAIGWQNGHPFEFRIGDRILGLAGSRSRNQSDAGRSRRRSPTCWPPAIPSNTTTCWAKIGSTRLRCLSRGAAQSGVRYPHLVSAQGRCPPADIGGPVGYDTYLRTIADPASINHARHAGIRRARFRSACGRRSGAARQLGESDEIYRPQNCEPSS